MNFSKYTNIPYKYKGSDFNGCDCWGLVKLIMKEERNIILPEFWYGNFWKNDYISNNIKNTNVTIVDYPYQIFDGILFYNQERKFANHMGLIIDENRFIHTYRESMRIDLSILIEKVHQKLIDWEAIGCQDCITL